MADEEVIDAEVVEDKESFDKAQGKPEGSEVAVEEQAQQPSSAEAMEGKPTPSEEEPKIEPEVPPESPNPIPETTVNIVIPPVAEETGDTEGIERAKEELAQIHGEEPNSVEESKAEETQTPVISNGEPTTEEIYVPKETDPALIKPYTIRSEETGDKVYVVVSGKRYWIKNPETLKKLGFNLGGESNIPFADLLKFPEGKPVDLTIPGAVNPWDEPEEEQPSGEGSNVWG